MLAQLGQHLRPSARTQSCVAHSVASDAMPLIVVGAAGLDGGNIQAVDLSCPDDLRLRISPDVPCVREDGKEHFHWFYFAARGVRGQRCAFKIVNAGEASYAWKGWPSIEAADPGFKARVSYDQQEWHQCSETYYNADTGVLTIELTPSADEVFVAAFEPYSSADHATFLAEITSPTWSLHRPGSKVLAAQHRVIGTSLDGAPIDLVTLPGGPLKIWLFGRQHPGETMGSFFIEGLLRRLVAGASTVCATVLKEATILAVPHTNPDGGSRGHLRTNAAGANLNREWAAPNPCSSPEILCIRNEMDRLGCDLCLDIHGSEGIPRVWGTLCTAWTPRLAALCEDFLDGWARVSPDFDRAFCNMETDLENANLDICTAQVGHRFGA